MTEVNMNTEPAGIIGAITALVASTFAVLAFVVPIPDGLQAAVIGLIIAAAPIIQLVLTRAKVYSPRTHRTVVAEKVLDTMKAGIAAGTVTVDVEGEPVGLACADPEIP